MKRINDGENPTTNRSDFALSTTAPKSQSGMSKAKSKIKKHFRDNWVNWLFSTIRFVLVQSLFFGVLWIIYQIYELKQTYAVLEERSKNAQSSLINEANCKNNVLVDCYGKCTFRQVVEKQHACEPTK